MQHMPIIKSNKIIIFLLTFPGSSRAKILLCLRNCSFCLLFIDLDWIKTVELIDNWRINWEHFFNRTWRLSNVNYVSPVGLKINHARQIIFTYTWYNKKTDSNRLGFWQQTICRSKLIRYFPKNCIYLFCYSQYE